MFQQQRFSQIIISILFLFITTFSFAQTGTYEVVNEPPEVFIAKNADGTFDIPPLIVGRATIKLKRSGKGIIIQDDYLGNKMVLTGTWNLDGDKILLSIETEAEAGVIEYKLEAYESGVYLKEVKIGSYLAVFDLNHSEFMFFR